MQKILILLSTYNGEKYLQKQLASLFFQIYSDFRIIVRDDASIDKTLDILNSYDNDIKLLPINKNVGVKKSFETLLKYALENSDSDYFMFCDQDDIWCDNKVEKTLLKIKELENMHGKDIPLLVHTDLTVVNENLDLINPSFMDYQKLDYKKDSLNSLLVQNIVTGCTMMINRKLANLCLPISDDSIMHDWWIVLVASCFGKIGYLNESTIKYRQHNKNSIGAKGYNSVYIKKSILKENILDKYIYQAKAFLERYEEFLTKEQKEILVNFISLQNVSFFEKRYLFLKYRFFKHGFIRNIGLFIKI